jgi:hypothetical protein
VNDGDRTGRDPGRPRTGLLDRSTAATLCGPTAREVARFGQRPTSIARDPGRTGRAGLEQQPSPRPRAIPPPARSEDLDEPTPAERQQIRDAIRAHRGA